jgi:hypothetical protein
MTKRSPEELDAVIAAAANRPFVNPFRRRERLPRPTPPPHVAAITVAQEAVSRLTSLQIPEELIRLSGLAAPPQWVAATGGGLELVATDRRIARHVPVATEAAAAAIHGAQWAAAVFLLCAVLDWTQMSGDPLWYLQAAAYAAIVSGPATTRSVAKKIAELRRLPLQILAGIFTRVGVVRLPF